MGRPTNNPKINRVEIRIDNDTLNKLDSLVKENGTNRSIEIRESINERFTKK